jgi:type II secretory ATPase GspE/PulE/Tfp pilus assembly ATPase PilB-like protein
MADAVQIVEQVIAQAVQAGASDVHLEPAPSGLRVRYRIDGVLYDQALIDLSLMSQVLSRVKVLAEIDISQKRIPQDGKFKITHQNTKQVINNNSSTISSSNNSNLNNSTNLYSNHNTSSISSSNNSNNTRQIDLRIATFPSATGEKIVLRILDRDLQPLQLTELGLPGELLTQFSQLIQRPSGFLLVTGPTGSGKTTTLYAALQTLHTPERHIITLEDPIEYHLAGITQGQIFPEAGFTFAKGVRALLRQDPDIVLIGEIRDPETAKIAIEAALAGRMVFSTLHTNSASSAVMRLIDMGVEAFLINAAVTGVLAQRLVRKLCDYCKISSKPTVAEQAFLKNYNLKLDLIYHSQGCAQCHNLGYRGRLALFELLLVSDKLRELISVRPNLGDLEQQAKLDGMKSLILDGLQKVATGQISLAELIRVVA